MNQGNKLPRIAIYLFQNYSCMKRVSFRMTKVLPTVSLRFRFLKNFRILQRELIYGACRIASRLCQNTVELNKLINLVHIAKSTRYSFRSHSDH